MVAHANSAARSDFYTMIGGLAVQEEIRGAELSAVLLEELCKNILSEGRKPCCFSDRGESHNIFTKLGFGKVGIWGTLTKSR